MLLIGLVLAFLVPTPVRAPTPQELDFAARRADYEAVVDVAKQHQFKFPSQYPNDFVRINDLLPSALSTKFGGSIIVPNGDIRLVDDWEPMVFFYLGQGRPAFYILYVEQSASSRCGGGSFDTKFDDHWYLCEDVL